VLIKCVGAIQWVDEGAVRLLLRRLERARFALAAAVIVCCCTNPPTAIATPTGVAPTATATASRTVTPATLPPGLRTPQGYLLPAECQYIDSGTINGSATTWKISCPQGLPSNYLRPSLTAQSWVSCGTNVWQKSGLQTSVIDAVNVSGFTGWLDQRPISRAACAQPTPPPGGSAGPP
jgi:hypothetical protein